MIRKRDYEPKPLPREMKITSIQRRKYGYYRLRTPRLEVLVNRETLDKEGFKKKDMITKEQIYDLLDNTRFDRAVSKSLWYLERADYSKERLYKKLVNNKKEPHRPEVARQAVDYLEERGYINDRRYAENLIDYWSKKSLSMLQLKRKLFEKDVPKELADELLEEVEIDYPTQIKNLVEKKYLKKLKEDDGFKKVFASLAKRGFPYNEIRKVLNAYADEFYLNEDLYDDD